MSIGSECSEKCKCNENCKNRDAQNKKFISPEKDIKIQNVWGMDCYSRKCLEISIQAIGKSLQYAQEYIKVHIQRTINTISSESAHNLNYTLIKLAGNDDLDISLTAIGILEQV